MASRPRTVSLSIGQSDWKPCAIMCAPPMPWMRASCRCGRNPDSSLAASTSPDGSPATMAIETPARAPAAPMPAPAWMPPSLSADDATGRRIDEQAHVADLLGRRRRGLFFGHQRDLGLFQRHAGAVDQFVGGADAVDLLAREAAPFEALDVDAVGLRRIAVQEHIRRHVLRQAGAHADEGVRADLAELVHVGEAAHDDPVADFDVAGQLRVVREDGVAADLAIVRQVDVGRDPVVVAEPRHAGVLHGADVEGAEFADGVAVADFQARRLALPLHVLRRGADGRELEELVVLADGRVAFDDDVRADDGAGADAHVRADDRIRPDFNVVAELRLRVDDGGGMYRRHDYFPAGWLASSALRMVYIKSASTATLPSTLPTALYFQMPRETRRISTFITSWSPGSTGRLKRALSMPTK